MRDRTDDRHDVAARRKPEWQTPTILFAAHVRDCVKGQGKTGPNNDADPQSTAKGGGG